MRFTVPISIRCLLALLLAWNVAATAQQNVNVLKDVRYNTLAEASRISLFFTGKADFTSTQSGLDLMLLFSNTQVAPTLGAAKLRFRSGLVEKFYITRLDQRGLKIEISLREQTTVRFINVQDGSILVIEAPHDGLKAGTMTAITRQPYPPQTKKQESSPTPVPAMATSGMELPTQQLSAEKLEAIKQKPNQGAGLQTNSAQVVREAERETDTSSSRTSLLVMVGALVLCFVGTLGLLYFGLRSKNPRAESQPSVIVAMPEAAKQQARELSIHAKNIERALVGLMGGTEEGEGESTPLAMAKTYARGQGEMDLALRMDSLDKHRPKKRILSADALKNATKEKRVREAKKMGIGKGEIDLALHLIEFQNEKIRKEGLP